MWHECNDVDLAVWLSDLSNLKSLKKTLAGTLNDLHQEERIGVAHHQVELFILEPGTDRYLGRLCIFGACPKGKPDCYVPGCGASPFLKQHEGFEFYPDALDQAVVLYDRNATREQERSTSDCRSPNDD